MTSPKISIFSQECWRVGHINESKTTRYFKPATFKIENNQGNSTFSSFVADPNGLFVGLDLGGPARFPYDCPYDSSRRLLTKDIIMSNATKDETNGHLFVVDCLGDASDRVHELDRAFYLSCFSVAHGPDVPWKSYDMTYKPFAKRERRNFQGRNTDCLRIAFGLNHLLPERPLPIHRYEAPDRVYPIPTLGELLWNFDEGDDRDCYGCLSVRFNSLCVDVDDKKQKGQYFFEPKCTFASYVTNYGPGKPTRRSDATDADKPPDDDKSSENANPNKRLQFIPEKRT